MIYFPTICLIFMVFMDRQIYQNHPMGNPLNPSAPENLVEVPNQRRASQDCANVAIHAHIIGIVIWPQKHRGKVQGIPKWVAWYSFQGRQNYFKYIYTHAALSTYVYYIYGVYIYIYFNDVYIYICILNIIRYGDCASDYIYS